MLNICGLTPLAITTPLTTLTYTSGGTGYDIDYSTFFTSSIIDASCNLLCYLKDFSCASTIPAGSFISQTSSAYPFTIKATNI